MPSPLRYVGVSRMDLKNHGWETRKTALTADNRPNKNTLGVHRYDHP